MSAEERTFRLTWEGRLRARPEELTALVLDPEQLAHWCRTVFMECEILDRGAADGLGMTTRAYAKGILPHAFIVTSKITHLVPHKFMHVEVTGDLEGYAELEVFPHGADELLVSILWHVDCRHRIIGPITRLFPLVFRANHHWTRNRGFALMQREIDRRRAGLLPAAASTPTFPHNFPRLRRFFYLRRQGESRPSGNSAAAKT